MEPNPSEKEGRPTKKAKPGKGPKKGPKKGPGRPSKYKKAYAEKLVEFFSIEPYKKEVIKVLEKFGKDGKCTYKSEDYKLVPNVMPTFFSFAMSIRVSDRVLENWAKDKKKPEFIRAYNTAKHLQKQFLTTIGLGGMAPPASFIFVAKNVTDYTDKVEVPVDPKGNPVGFIVLPARKTKEEAEKEFKAQEGQK